MNVFGRCSPKFAQVEKVFRKNFSDGWEREGASVAIFWQGQLVVDLYGGFADKSSKAEWKENTRTVLFSASKAVAALAVHMLVERNSLAYSDAVSKFWPEFAKNGKESVTIEDILNHKAGLAAIDTPILIKDALSNPKRISEILENQKPNWEPGTKSGYHAVSFGWLTDQLVRRIDSKSRSMAEFVRDEITHKHDIDFHLGLPLTESYTVSRLSMPNWMYIIREVFYDPRTLAFLGILHIRSKNSLRSRMARNPEWININSKICTLNNPEIFPIEQAGALGIGKAKDLACIFAKLLSGEFLSRKTLEYISRPQMINHRDFVLMVPVNKGNGFMYERHPRKKDKWLFGHPGFGGTSVMVSPDDQLVIAYVTNGLKTGMGELNGTYRRIRDAAFNSIN
uniref:Beta-lactamase-related domain-containing protein n=1 Tax=Meloidogyne enterolobii TaxID=390850 RepID=A0A6V7U2T6_MELEN|nr:unnamed protein product [Meloidogyne enterolobii]